MTFAGELCVVNHVPQAFAELVAREAPRSIALSGGDTARRCYELLAVADVAWREVTVFFGDERWVPVGDPDSNEGMARETFVDEALPRAVHPMYRAGTTIDAAAAHYDALLHAYGPVDLVHLGLGPDGHTASLFPGSPALDESERWAVATGGATHPHPRLTVTLPWLATAHLVVFTVAGSDKRDALARVRAGEDLPAARVRAERIIWLVDDAALGDRIGSPPSA